MHQYWTNDSTTPVTIVLLSATYFEHCLWLVFQENLIGWSLDRMGKDSMGLNFYWTEFVSS